MERIQMVKAMEFIVRQINNEDIFEAWPELCIDYMDVALKANDVENLGYYTDDKIFAELMGLFLRIMRAASKDSGMCCDGIVSRP